MIKCLIWDLDDTLWRGTLSENWEVVFPGECRNLIMELDKRGILQSIASRNDEALVLQKLEELDIRQYFLYPQCNFGSKTESIQRITAALNISMDAVGYIDDNPFEIFEIQYFLPGIRTYKAEEIFNLLNYPEFNPGKITKEASTRRQMMIAREARNEAERRFTGSREDFLKECRMELTVGPAQTEDVDRIYELAIRTNQLNNMKEPLDKPAILDYIHGVDRQILVAKLTDRFGDHGLIGACFLETKSRLIVIRLFCISCRIEGRGVGVAFLGEALNRLQTKHPGINEIQCPFKATARNRPALMLLKMLGFKRKAKREEYDLYSLPVPHAIEKVAWVKIVDGGDSGQFK